MEVEKFKRSNKDRNWLHSNNSSNTITVMNRNNIGSNHITVLSNIKLDVEVERKTVDEQKAIDNI